MTAAVAVGVSAGVAGTVSDAVAIGVAVAVSVGLGDSGHPSSELSTAWRTSLIVTLPSLFASKAGHALTGKLPSVMLMPVISSSMVTAPESSQSPTQVGGWATAMDAVSSTSTAAHVNRNNERRRDMLQLVTREAASNTQCRKQAVSRRRPRPLRNRSLRIAEGTRTGEAAQPRDSSPMPSPPPLSGASPSATLASFIAAR